MQFVSQHLFVPPFFHNVPFGAPQNTRNELRAMSEETLLRLEMMACKDLVRISAEGPLPTLPPSEPRKGSSCFGPWDDIESRRRPACSVCPWQFCTS